MTPNKAPSDFRVIACNVKEGSSWAAPGALAYLGQSAPMGFKLSIDVVVRSRGGRWIQITCRLSKLHNFRPKTIPPTHPMYRRCQQYAIYSFGDEAPAKAQQFNEWAAEKEDAEEDSLLDDIDVIGGGELPQDRINRKVTTRSLALPQRDLQCSSHLERSVRRLLVLHPSLDAPFLERYATVRSEAEVSRLLSDMQDALGIAPLRATGTEGEAIG